MIRRTWSQPRGVVQAGRKVTVLGRMLSAIVASAIAGSLLVLALPTRAAPTATLPALAPAATTAMTFTVDTYFDGVNPGACANHTVGQCTLREAVLEANANPGSTVVLPGLLAIHNYELTIPRSGTDGTTGALLVAADMSIVGHPGLVESVIINAIGANDRAFFIASGVSASISNVTIRYGTAPAGGGVYNAGTLTLANSTVFSNTASGISNGSGGGIYNAGTLTLMNSTVISNTAGGLGGGGISNGSGRTLILSHSTVGGNTAGIAGGIRNFGSLLASDSTVSGNSACCGGGIYNDLAGTLTLGTSTVTGNTASDDGGGINNTGLLTLTTSTVAGNTALVGGGIENASVLVITGSLILSNTANAGGGIENASLVTLVNSTVGSNTASNIGGGIYNGGRLTLDGGTVISNTASGGGGGGIYVGAAGTLTLSKSTVAGNTASAGGGGIENGGSLVATNSTLSGNAGKYGGGLYSHSAASLTASTLVGNSAATGGGGFYQAAQYPTQTLSLANTIIAGSPSGGNCAIDVTGYSPHSNGYNLSGDGTCAPYLTQPGDRNNANPNLGPLADNGGPTLTHLPQFPSPAMDAIPLGTNGCGTTLTTDQRGMPRALDGRCDTGAVENGARLSWLYLPLIAR